MIYRPNCHLVAPLVHDRYSRCPDVASGVIELHLFTWWHLMWMSHLWGVMMAHPLSLIISNTSTLLKHIKTNKGGMYITKVAHLDHRWHTLCMDSAPCDKYGTPCNNGGTPCIIVTHLDAWCISNAPLWLQVFHVDFRCSISTLSTPCLYKNSYPNMSINTPSKIKYENLKPWLNRFSRKPFWI